MKNAVCAVVGLVLLGLAGCAALKATAPPVSPQMVQIAEKHRMNEADLTAGRDLLATRCTSCHSLMPLAAYTPAQWSANVQKMAPRAKLTPAEATRVTAYLVAAREAMP
ncbi:MAG TPA: hypothetical protein VIM48_06405 [Chthoniobacterales bacterium]